jgi:L-threonylcarbamoyladenylate synthase
MERWIVASGNSGRAAITPAASPRAIEWAAEELTRGGVIAIPTDTVYGLAASLNHPEAIDRIFSMKGRDQDRPLPVLVSSVAAVENVTVEIGTRQQLLFETFWPGPVTFVVISGRSLPRKVLAADGTVAVRLPNHPLAIEVIEKAGGAVACTSANRSSELPALRAEDIGDSLGASLDFILDGGVAPGGRASTVAAIRGGHIEVLREGPIQGSAIQAAWDSYAENL